MIEITAKKFAKMYVKNNPDRPEIGNKRRYFQLIR